MDAAARAVKRGSTQCVNCGCSNGNRAFSCKSCDSPLPGKRPKLQELAPRASSIVHIPVKAVIDNTKVYSCRVRSEGPDFRTFVTENHGKWKCFYRECQTAQEARSRSLSSTATCVEQQGGSATSCQHISAVHKDLRNCRETTSQNQLSPNVSLLPDLPIPPSVKNDLQKLADEALVPLQKISKESFVIRDLEQSQEHPLGLLHVRFRKTSAEPHPLSDSGETRALFASYTFYCPCNAFKRYSSSFPGPAMTPKPSRRCIHFYTCLWAFASDSNLAKEFSFFLQSLNAPPPTVGRKHTCVQLQSTSSSTISVNGAQDLQPVHSPETDCSITKTTHHTPCTKAVVRGTPTQEELKRRSVQAFMMTTEPLPEDPEDIPHILQHIARCSAGAVSLPSPATCGESTQWPTTFCPAQTYCVLCNSKLTCPTHIPGSNGKSYLLTRMGMTHVTALVKRCSNEDCMARYGYNTWNEGVFNISNKLFVSLDILFDMRSHVKQGEPPGNCAHAVLESTCLSGNKLNLSQSELRYLEQKLYDGYFAFKAITHRDWNAGICGVCGIAPVFESGDGNCKNCTPLKKGQCVWPDSTPDHFTGVVDIDGWWKAVEENIVEASVFTAAKPMPIEAHTIAPWIPPIARASTVINTELWKGCNQRQGHMGSKPVGCPKQLAELIRSGRYDPARTKQMTQSELREICQAAEISVPVNTTKPQMLILLERLHSFVLQGRSECHVFEAAPACTGGKVFKNCHHQVISATKYVIRKESTRDHVDLLLSSRHWPVVYAVDMACDVVAHVQARDPQLANELWGDRRGCFERPSAGSLPKVTRILELENPHSIPTPTDSILALRDHDYCASSVHPLTQTRDRFIVGDRFHDGPQVSGHKKPTCKFHNMRLCPELNQFQSVTSEVINSKIKSTRLQSSSQQNMVHYFLYNRLMDYWHNIEIVNKQLQEMKSRLQPGERIVRDSIWRFVYARIA